MRPTTKEEWETLILNELSSGISTCCEVQVFGVSDEGASINLADLKSEEVIGVYQHFISVFTDMDMLIRQPLILPCSHVGGDKYTIKFTVEYWK